MFNDFNYHHCCDRCGREYLGYIKQTTCWHCIAAWFNQGGANV